MATMRIFRSCVTSMVVLASCVAYAASLPVSGITELAMTQSTRFAVALPGGAERPAVACDALDFRGDFGAFSLALATEAQLSAAGLTPLVGVRSDGDLGGLVPSTVVLGHNDACRSSIARVEAEGGVGVPRLRFDNGTLLLFGETAVHWPACADVISVPPRCIPHPRPPAHVPAATEDARVRRLVSLVQRGNLEATVRHLSSYHTRMSTTPGAQDARRWLEAQYKALGLRVSTLHFRDGFSEGMFLDPRSMGSSAIPSKIFSVTVKLT